MSAAGEILFRARNGPAKLLRWLTDRLLDRYSDKKFGIVSSQRKTASELGFDSSEYVPYQAVNYTDMEEILAILQPGADDVFLDLGCGMGRAVCMAGMHRMRSVIGVEISPELCQIAIDNVAKMTARLACRDVRIVNSDAASYTIPGDVSILYLFNPFGGSVLRRVFENVNASLQVAQRPLRLIFSGTLSSRSFAEEAARHSWLKLTSKHVLRSGLMVLVYQAAG